MEKLKNQQRNEEILTERIVEDISGEREDTAYGESPAIQLEDAALKTSMRAFADVLLPYLKIKGKVVSYGATELVYLDLKKLYQDFNLVMEDGTWKHFEFQSKNEGRKGLKRFRSYEAVTSYQNNVEVTTYVLFSGKIKNPMTELTEGVNTYRIIPIIMRSKNADRIIKRLLKKQKNGRRITKKDLAPLMLCPLMGGEMPQKERIQTAFQLTQSSTGLDTEDVQNIETVLYAMAEKFLEPLELKEIKEEIGMGGLSRLYFEDGISQGIKQGISQGISQGITQGISQGKEMAQIECAKKLLTILSADKIAEVLEMPLDIVQGLESAGVSGGENEGL